MAVASHAWQVAVPDPARGSPFTLTPDARESMAVRVVRGVAAPLLSRLPFSELVGSAMAGAVGIAVRALKNGP